VTWHLVLLILSAEARYQLPPALLVAVVSHESSGKFIVTRERQGGCSIGWAQIYAGDCNGERARRFRDMRENVYEGARLLARSRAKCAAHPRWLPCRRWEYSLYNALSAKWSRNVKRIHRGLTLSIGLSNRPAGVVNDRRVEVPSA
jgi:hypothetical protein